MASVSLTQEYNYEYIYNMNILVEDDQDDDFNEDTFINYTTSIPIKKLIPTSISF